MAQRPTPQAATIRRLIAALRDAEECMRDVAARLDFNTIGRSKFRLIRCADRANRAAGE